MTAGSRKKLPPIPDYLIYEMDDGKPIYYRGYKDVIKGIKTSEEIMGSSILQSMVIELIKNVINAQLSKNYIILSNELGLLFSKKSWRLADIAIFDKKALLVQGIKDEYSKVPPKIVIEVDTKAHFEQPSDVSYYYHHKTDQLLDFGVERVIWIYTGSEKFMIAEKDQRWETANWTEDIEIMPGIVVNIPKLIEEFYQPEED
ncbi:MAG: Uma2 family endonuclease [Saprospiraceae bacterium]